MSPHVPILAPSLLAGDHGNLRGSLRAIPAPPVRWIHLDIMDGHFVPNLSFGPATIAALRGDSELFFDTHLMLSRPDRYLDAFVEAGADQITIHVEPDYDKGETLARLKAAGRRRGLALNPDTPLSAAIPYFERIDLLLLMTVQPGFGGQAFREDVLPKIVEANRIRADRGLEFRLEVDGGIGVETARRCRAAGADTFVAGSAYFQAEDREAFREAVEGPFRP